MLQFCASETGKKINKLKKLHIFLFYQMHDELMSKKKNPLNELIINFVLFLPNKSVNLHVMYSMCVKDHEDAQVNVSKRKLLTN